MRVEFVRSGGFAGILLVANIDFKNLPPDESAILEKQIEAADFFRLPEVIKPAAAAPDRFEYQITVSSPTQMHTVSVSESLVVDSLRPLIEHLTDLARTGKYR